MGPMSIPVGLAELSEAVREYAFAYLITTGPDDRPHAVAVTPRLTDGGLRIDEPGRRTRRNAAAHTAVALVYPPAEPGGYSLIVDGDASAQQQALTIAPTSAVLHRAAAPGGHVQEGCGSDCRPLQV